MPVKYKDTAIDRIFIAKLISLFYLFLELQSDEFVNLVIGSDILKYVVELWEIYDDHSLIQSTIRNTFEIILEMEDINIK